MAAPPLLLPRTAPVLLSLVLFSGGKAPTDVPLGLIGVQNDLDLFVQGLIVLGQALGQVLVNRGLGNPKFLRRCPDGGPVFDHVHSQLAGSLSDVIRHTRPSLLCRDKTLYAGKSTGMSGRPGTPNCIGAAAPSLPPGKAPSEARRMRNGDIWQAGRQNRFRCNMVHLNETAYLLGRFFRPASVRLQLPVGKETAALKNQGICSPGRFSFLN